MQSPSPCILTINNGSSSIKFSIYAYDRSETALMRGGLEHIGGQHGRMGVCDGSGRRIFEDQTDFPDNGAALEMLFRWLQGRRQSKGIAAIGHRIVHGGPHCQPKRISKSVLADIQKLQRFVPEHLPREIDAVKAAARAFPDACQIACFDTFFHRDLPLEAGMYGLPRDFYERGIRRYGFHGISCEYIMGQLRAQDAAYVAGKRVLIAHLGHGSSLTAVAGGRSVDTTMGFTPAEGLIMGTRSGDIDPGLCYFMAAEQGMTPSEINELLNRRSGLLGISGTTSNMQALLEAEAGDRRAAEAVTLYCYRVRKYIGAMAAVMSGLDTLVFTGGIGENAPAVRERICSGLGFLGIAVDPALNTNGNQVISGKSSRVDIRVMKTDEESIIAMHTCRLLKKRYAHRPPRRMKTKKTK